MLKEDFVREAAWITLTADKGEGVQNIKNVVDVLNGRPPADATLASAPRPGPLPLFENRKKMLARLIRFPSGFWMETFVASIVAYVATAAKVFLSLRHGRQSAEVHQGFINILE